MEYEDTRRGEFGLTAARERIDVGAVHAFLTRSFWAEGISRDLVARSIANSLCVGLFHGSAQIGFARVVTDSSTYAYLCDVYVLEEYRGQGLGTWMMEYTIAHPDLQGLRRFQLVTRDAHRLYRRVGFSGLSMPDRHMEIFRPDMYRNGGRQAD